MSLANLRFWGKNKVAFANLPNNKEIPLEIRGSIISDAKFNPDENSTRDLFWAAKSGDIDILEDYLSDSDIVHDKFECNRLDRHKLSPLHYAAKYNRIDVVKYLLRYGADIDCIGGDGVTPLLIAAKHNSVDALKVLITLNGSITLSNCNGESPLHVASRLGHIEACKALLEVSPILVNRVDRDKMTALHIACVKAKKEVCACLLEHGADINLKAVDGSLPIHYAADKGSTEIISMILEHSSSSFSTFDQIEARDNEKQTPLHRAAQRGYKSAIKLCLEFNSDISAVQKQGQTPLHLAVISGQRSAVELLIASNIDIECRDYRYKTPLHLASCYGHKKIIQLLLKNGANIDSVDGRHKTALLLAIENGKSEIVKFLLDQGASCMIMDDKNQSCLHIAANFDRLEILKDLLNRGAQALINEPDTHGRTAFHYAAENGHYNVVSLLAENGSNIDSIDEDDNTPLHLACKTENQPIIQFICRRAPPLINHLGDKSRTPLHVAVVGGHKQTVQFCLKNGADAERRDCSYMTPLEIAVNAGYIKIVQVLLKHGVSINTPNANAQSLLHVAAAKGYNGIVIELLRHGAKIDSLDEENYSCLDVAVINCQESVAITLINHNQGKELLKRVHKDGLTCMQHMVEKLPNAAKVAMDSCISYQYLSNETIISNCSESSQIKEIFYDFTLIDPGPEFESRQKVSSRKNRNNALMTMVKSKQIDLLNHELAIQLRNFKWKKYGQYLYYFNLLLYIIFLVALTTYVIILQDSKVFNDTTRKPIIGLRLYPVGLEPTAVTPTANKGIRAARASTALPYFNQSIGSRQHMSGSNMLEKQSDELSNDFQSAAIEVENQTQGNNSDLKNTTTSTPTVLLGTPGVIFLANFMETFGYINVMKEIYQLYHQRLSYFKSVSNYFDLAVYILLIVTGMRIEFNVAMGLYSLLIFLAYIDLLLHMEMLDHVGIFVLMLESVLISLLNISEIVVLLTFAFGVSFYVLNPKEPAFYNVPLSMVKVLNMMVGEIEYQENWFHNIQTGRMSLTESITSLVMIVIFIFLMPVILMNLMVGLAVGDIDKVRREAGLRLISTRIEYLDDLERTLPRKLRHYFYIGYHTVYERNYQGKPPIGNHNHNHSSVAITSRKDSANQDALMHMSNIYNELNQQGKRIDNLGQQLGELRESFKELISKLDGNT